MQDFKNKLLCKNYPEKKVLSDDTNETITCLRFKRQNRIFIIVFLINQDTT